MMAGLDGMMNKIVPPDPVDRDLYEMPEEEQRKIGDTPPTLKAALDALEEDHDYLLRGNVFTPDVMDTWVRYKRSHELAYLDQRPHPAEFALYYDC
jgi:glutamine synthetase